VEIGGIMYQGCKVARGGCSESETVVAPARTVFMRSGAAQADGRW